MIEGTGGRSKQLLGNLKEKRDWILNEKALDRNLEKFGVG